MQQRKPKGYWTKEKVLEEAKKCKSAKEFYKSFFYKMSKRLNIHKECVKVLPLKTNPQGYWTKERVLQEAKKCKTRTEFYKSPAGSAANKLGIIKQCVSHLESKTKPRSYWTKEKVLEKSREYQTRTDFHKSGVLYSIAKELGIHSECTEHMKWKSDKKKRALYAFEFSDKSVYVGLTYNYDARYKQHMRDHKTIVEKCKMFDCKFVKYNVWFDSSEVGNKEKDLMEKYKQNGWVLINKKAGGGQGFVGPYWTKEKIFEESKKYTNVCDFKSKANGARGAAIKLGIYEECTQHMHRKITFWNRENVIIEAKKYQTRTRFRKGSRPAYDKAKELGIFEECVKHMYFKKTKPQGYWTKEKVLDECKKIKTVRELRHQHQTLYVMAFEFDIYKQCTSHMKRGKSGPKRTK